MTEPVACRLDPAGQLVRREEASALMRRALVDREPTAHGVRLRFSTTGGAEDEVRDLVRREQECCPFFSFTLARDGDHLLLDAEAPPEARELLDGLFAAWEA